MLRNDHFYADWHGGISCDLTRRRTVADGENHNTAVLRYARYLIAREVQRIFSRRSTGDFDKYSRYGI